MDFGAGLFARAIAEAPADSLGDGHAALVPTERAADRINRADCSAALRIRATVAAVDRESGTRTWATVGAHTDDRTVGGAGFIPGARAAGWIDRADLGAAVFVFAGRQIARERAGAGARIAAIDGESVADRRGAVHAEDVPLREAAGRIEIAHGVTAVAIKAGG